MNLSAGEAGGMFAGAVAALAVLGKGIAWLLNWHGERSNDRSAKLQAWEDKLNARERSYRESIEQKLEQMEREVAATHDEIETVRRQSSAMGLMLVDVTSALSVSDATNPALRRTARTLRAMFPLDHEIPAHLAELIERLDQLG